MEKYCRAEQATDDNMAHDRIYKAKNKHSQYITVNALPLQEWLHERASMLRCKCVNNKVRELIAVKVLHTSLLNTIVVVFKVLPLGSYAPMPAPSPTLKTILEMPL